MQPEEVRTVARQLLRLADDVYLKAEQIESSLQGLLSRWQGNSSDDFATAAEAQVRHLNDLAGRLIGLARCLHREVDKWEAVDRHS